MDIYMKTIVRYSLDNNTKNNKLKNRLSGFEPFDIVIEASDTCSASNIITDKLRNKFKLDLPTLIEQVPKYSPIPKSVYLCGIRTVAETAEILSVFKNSLLSLQLFKCQDLVDLSFLEELPHLKTLEIYWNRKATRLFNASCMPDLSKLSITDCNHIVDFDGLKNSSIEELELYGCNNCSSFVSKLDVGEKEFLQHMPRLRSLGLDIMRTHSDEFYLKKFAQLKNLQRFIVSRSFFTFEQFAWLSAQLPNVTEGLEPCLGYSENGGVAIVDGDEQFSVIGRRKPSKANKVLAQRYQLAYTELRKQFNGVDEPPTASFSVKI